MSSKGFQNVACTGVPFFFNYTNFKIIFSFATNKCGISFGGIRFITYAWILSPHAA